MSIYLQMISFFSKDTHEIAPIASRLFCLTISAVTQSLVPWYKMVPMGMGNTYP